jgi:UDP-2-acetamido-2,6-beta-L-arabino-hexul-4-ose reductase
MSTIVVTGAAGFVGRNLVAELSNCRGHEVSEVSAFDVGDTDEALEAALARADFVFHLAGVNRPQDVSEFETGNKDFTGHVLGLLEKHNRAVPVVITSSIQAALDNPYGASKKGAEEAAFAWARRTGGAALVYRLPNLFGKWCRPNYNSVTATFCHNIAHDLPIQVSDPDKKLELVYIGDLLEEFMRALAGEPHKGADGFCSVPVVHSITVGELAGMLQSFRRNRSDLYLPNFANPLVRAMYATYVSYLPENDFSYKPEMKRDERGWLAELIKQPGFGQIFVSRTKPGITRGNHWHHTKVEKFIVVEGEAVIRFRKVGGSEVLEYPVSGLEMTIVDIPAGYTHSITNVGETDVVTLFWSDEVFDPGHPDTYYLGV